MYSQEAMNQIKNSLTIEQIFHFLETQEAEPCIKDNIIISKTICHNHKGEGSHKLYYYDNTKLFKCYTDCDDTFDIFELVIKIKTREKEKQEMCELLEEFAKSERAQGRLEGKREGILEGKLEGKLEGQREEKISLAVNMTKMGFNLETISQALNCSIDSVKELLASKKLSV